ncbi:MAG: Ldh family oxidoreductase [Planctomycetota bacterium]
MSSVKTTTFPIEALQDFAARVFLHHGVPEDEAATAAEVLAASDLRGIDSHGVARMWAYHDMLRAGRINPRPKPFIVRESASTATVDGDNGLGLVVGPWANRVAIAKARDAGSGWVSVANTNHYGIAGYYVLEAVKAGQIGWSMTNTTKLVAPLWGAERMLGTNPIAIGFPGGEEPSVVVDLATCAAAYGKVEIARRHGKSIPDGWAIDSDGHMTTDPDVMMAGGALSPLGGDREHGGHKGYALAVAVDLLCCVLSGANWGPFAPPFTLQQQIPTRSVGKGIGHFFGALRVDAFVDPEEFARQMDDYVRTMRATKPAPGTDGPLIPGDPEREAEAHRRVHGIPVVDAVVADLQRVAQETGVPLG